MWGSVSACASSAQQRPSGSVRAPKKSMIAVKSCCVRIPRLVGAGLGGVGEPVGVGEHPEAEEHHQPARGPTFFRVFIGSSSERTVQGTGPNVLPVLRAARHEGEARRPQDSQALRALACQAAAPVVVDLLAAADGEAALPSPTADAGLVVLDRPGRRPG